MIKVGDRVHVFIPATLTLPELDFTGTVSQADYNITPKGVFMVVRDRTRENKRWEAWELEEIVLPAEGDTIELLEKIKAVA